MTNEKYNWIKNRGFPAFGVLLLIIGIIFLLQENGYLPKTFQWWPIILIALGLIIIYEHYTKKK